jgi:hypothetical protein
MSYHISYDDGTPISVRHWRGQRGSRTESFASEAAALKRARQLLDAGDHHGIVVSDEAGNNLGGVRLQLKLGYTPE